MKKITIYEPDVDIIITSDTGEIMRIPGKKQTKHNKILCESYILRKKYIEDEISREVFYYLMIK